MANDAEVILKGIEYLIEKELMEAVAEHMMVTGETVGLLLALMSINSANSTQVTTGITNVMAYMYSCGYKDAKRSNMQWVVGEPDGS